MSDAFDKLLLILPPKKSDLGRTMASKQELRGSVGADLWTVIVGTTTSGGARVLSGTIINFTVQVGDGIVDSYLLCPDCLGQCSVRVFLSSA